MSSDTVPRHLTRAHMESALEEVIAAGHGSQPLGDSSPAAIF